jgi:hypothetical protein
LLPAQAAPALSARINAAILASVCFEVADVVGAEDVLLAAASPRILHSGVDVVIVTGAAVNVGGTTLRSLFYFATLQVRCVTY